MHCRIRHKSTLNLLLRLVIQQYKLTDNGVLSNCRLTVKSLSHIERLFVPTFSMMLVATS